MSKDFKFQTGLDCRPRFCIELELELDLNPELAGGRGGAVERREGEEEEETGRKRSVFQL